MKRFQDNARVCFVGDSITHKGIFLKHIVAYYRRKFPKSGVEFYNCGIAGGDLGNTLRVYDQDIAIYDPTHIVLMIGINDSHRTSLTAPASEERYEKLLCAYENYQKNMEKMYRLTKERGIELILCTPMPYAEYIKSEVEPLRGGCALIQAYADYVRAFASLHGIELCDYHATATRYMQSESLYSPDRVHPNLRAHELMAKTFLEAQGIEFESLDAFSEDIEAWYDTTQKLRNIITAEYLTVPNYTDLNDSERRAIVKKKYEGMKDGTYCPDSYFAFLIEAYMVNKPHQTEYVDFVKQFMKGNV